MAKKKGSALLLMLGLDKPKGKPNKMKSGMAMGDSMMDEPTMPPMPPAPPSLPKKKKAKKRRGKTVMEKSVADMY